MIPLRILGRKNSINVQKVVWLASELKVDFVREDYGGNFGKLQTAEFTKLNPNQLVPTMVHGDFVLWESNAICRYVGETFNDGNIWPKNPQHRAEADKWMDWQLTTLWPSVRTIFLGLVRTAPENRDMDALNKAKNEARKSFEILNNALDKKPFVAGDHLTLGDIAVAISAHRWIQLVPDDAVHSTNVLKWYETLRSRPSFKQHVVDIPLS